MGVSMRLNSTVLKHRNSNMIYACAITIHMLIAFLCESKQLYFLSGISLMILGLMGFFYFRTKSNSILNCRSIYFASWYCTMGLSALKIHPLQTNWSTATWLCFWLSGVLFLIGYEFGTKNRKRKRKINNKKVDPFYIIILLFSSTLIAFIFEAIMFKGVPLFSKSMSAYVDFSMPYIHYITVNCALIPALSIFYFYKKKRLDHFRKSSLLVMNAIMIAIPALILSRQLLILTFVIAFIAFMDRQKKIKIKKRHIIIIVIAIIIGWSYLTKNRGQNDAYLKRVFQLDEKLPVSLYQVYMYIAYNFDNFDAAVKTLTNYTFGFYSLNPLWTFTATKNLWPESITLFQVERPIYFYTTYVHLYYPYIDFGIAGVVIYSITIGFFAGRLERNKIEKKNRYVSSHLFLYSLGFSFFSAFLLNTSIWEYFIVLWLVRQLSVDRREIIYPALIE